MDGKYYTEILEKHIPEIRSMLRDEWRLQQDNNPKHTSRVAREFLNSNVPGVMDWPSNSPDLNPMKTYGRLSREMWRSVDPRILVN